jgi:hypothetical protein
MRASVFCDTLRAHAISPGTADIDMPGSTATGDYWNPPDSEACCGGTY